LLKMLARERTHDEKPSSLQRGNRDTQRHATYDSAHSHTREAWM